MSFTDVVQTVRSQCVESGVNAVKTGMFLYVFQLVSYCLSVDVDEIDIRSSTPTHPLEMIDLRQIGFVEKYNSFGASGFLQDVWS